MLGWLINIDFAASGVTTEPEPEPEEETFGGHGGWVREDDVALVEGLLSVRGRIRATASAGVAAATGSVVAPAIAEPGPEPVVVIPPVAGRVAALAMAGTAVATGEVWDKIADTDAMADFTEKWLLVYNTLKRAGKL